VDIVRLTRAGDDLRSAAARILTAAFSHIPVWSTITEARAEVDECFSADRVAFGVTLDGDLAGWVGAIKHSEPLWELHPIAVRPDAHRRGVGRLLVETLEDEAERQGALTISLGTDDEFGGTNLFGTDVYPTPLEHLTQLRVVTAHPYQFFERLGFSIVGVIPDANGPGKHDILMAKRVGRRSK
jgi:aminoglycoside 6'-N-acetyltransferase I